jgi:hypothetical protein
LFYPMSVFLGFLAYIPCFDKNKSKLIRPHCSLCVCLSLCVSPLATFERLNRWL